MAYVQTSIREGCFRPESITHFTVHSTVEFAQKRKIFVTFFRMFSGNAQIAEHHWAGDQALSYEFIGKILQIAEQSHEAVLSFDTLIEEQLKTPSASI